MIPLLIGISGYQGTGKDTLADYLVKVHGRQRYGFADPMKAVLNQRFGWTMEHWEDRVWKDTPSVYAAPRPGVLESGENISPRQLAQWLGTDVGRNLFGKNCWVDLFAKWYKHQLDLTRRLSDPWGVVISDVRFENEADMIRMNNGVIIHLTRPGCGPKGDHPSEAGIAARPLDYRIDNYGSIEDLYNTFEAIFA